MNALWTLGKLAQKPSDTKIRTWRIIFAILLILVITFGLHATDVNISLFDNIFADLPDELLYALYIFPIIGLIRGIFDPGLFRKAIWKWVIFGLGAAMFIFSVFFLSEKTPKIITTEQTAITADSTTTVTQVSQDPLTFVDTDNWLGFFGLITMFVGFFLTGRNITTKNEKFGEVIKKIRV